MPQSFLPLWDCRLGVALRTNDERDVRRVLLAPPRVCERTCVLCPVSGHPKTLPPQHAGRFACVLGRFRWLSSRTHGSESCSFLFPVVSQLLRRCAASRGLDSAHPAPCSSPLHTLREARLIPPPLPLSEPALFMFVVPLPPPWPSEVFPAARCALRVNVGHAGGAQGAQRAVCCKEMAPVHQQHSPPVHGKDGGVRLTASAVSEARQEIANASSARESLPPTWARCAARARCCNWGARRCLRSSLCVGHLAPRCCADRAPLRRAAPSRNAQVVQVVNQRAFSNSCGLPLAALVDFTPPAGLGGVPRVGRAGLRCAKCKGFLNQYCKARGPALPAWTQARHCPRTRQLTGSWHHACLVRRARSSTTPRASGSACCAATPTRRPPACWAPTSP